MMSTAIDNFTQQLHDNLEAVEDRVKSLKENLQSAPKKTQTEIQSKLDEAKTALEAKKHQFKEYRVKIQAQFEEKEAEVKENIRENVDEWKADRKVKKLEHRANKAEEYAATAIYLTMITLEEAEKATLEAIAARLDAKIAVESVQKEES
jgi:uncharacterized protein (DUF342 family)